MVNIRQEMPVLARHQGEWQGTYTLIDINGQILDHHNSYLCCQFPEDKPDSYYQINRYTWPDGKEQEFHFPGVYRDKKVWFDTERLEGYSWEVDDATLLLWITYKGIPESMYIYEMIQISPCNNHRARTWQWFKNDHIYQRTLIQETRIN